SADFPGTMAGPELPPCRTADAESSRSPPRCLSGPWHEAQCLASTGRTSAVKSAARAVAAVERTAAARRVRRVGVTFGSRTDEGRDRGGCVSGGQGFETRRGKQDSPQRHREHRGNQYREAGELSSSHSSCLLCVLCVSVVNPLLLKPLTGPVRSRR